MVRIYELAGGIAKGEKPILIRGEPGTGKRRLAQWIHELHRGPEAPFVQASWEELSEIFVEQHLFGHTPSQHLIKAARGSGLLELANGGTLYLQEIGRFSLATQAKLAHVIEDRRFELPGSHQTIKIDTRMILASSLDTDALLERGAFHRDLYDRVAACVIDIPPLRTRKEDILPLAFLAVRKFAAEYHKEAHHISSQACAALISYSWPGNLVELNHVIERAVVASRGAGIECTHLPVALRGDSQSDNVDEEKTLDTTLDNIERALIVDALKMAKGNQAKAAQLLGITERMMGLRVRKHGLAPRGFRSS